MVQIHEVRSIVLRCIGAAIFLIATILFLMISILLLNHSDREGGGYSFFQLLFLGPAWLMGALFRAIWFPLYKIDALGLWVRGGPFWPFQRSNSYNWVQVKKIYTGKTLSDQKSYLVLELPKSNYIRLISDYSGFENARDIVLKFAENAELVEEDVSGNAYID